VGIRLQVQNGTGAVARHVLSVARSPLPCMRPRIRPAQVDITPLHPTPGASSRDFPSSTPGPCVARAFIGGTDQQHTSTAHMPALRHSSTGGGGRPDTLTRAASRTPTLLLARPAPQHRGFAASAAHSLAPPTCATMASARWHGARRQSGSTGTTLSPCHFAHNSPSAWAAVQSPPLSSVDLPPGALELMEGSYMQSCRPFSCKRRAVLRMHITLHCVLCTAYKLVVRDRHEPPFRQPAQPSPRRPRYGRCR
jgi:hypothetical protein